MAGRPCLRSMGVLPLNLRRPKDAGTRMLWSSPASPASSSGRVRLDSVRRPPAQRLTGKAK